MFLSYSPHSKFRIEDLSLVRIFLKMGENKDIRDWAAARGNIGS